MRFFASRFWGHAGFFAFGWWGIIKAPWNPMLFSERYGYEKYRRLGFGWRWQVRRYQVNTQRMETRHETTDSRRDPATPRRLRRVRPHQPDMGD